MARICRFVFWIYVVLASLSLVLAVVGATGLIGDGEWALSAVYAVLLAQPWLLLTSTLTNGSNLALSLLHIGGCIFLNAAIIFAACRFARR